MICKCKLKRLLKRAIKKTNTKELNELLKKIIMYMTLGVDVSILFTDMCLISQYPDLLSKKMIYLYLGNYAEAKPKLALLAINTFLKELSNKDPKIRGLALRSLCSLKNQFPQTKDHIKDMLEDDDQYVQQIAVYGCLKVHYFDPNFIEDYKLNDIFYKMLKSPQPMIVISVINVLNEIFVAEGGMPITSKIIIYLLNRLKEFNDYGKGVIVQLAMRYTPKNDEEKIKIMNVLDYKFRSTNSDLVISIIKLFLKYNKDNSDIFEEVLNRIKDCLLTLLVSAGDESKFNLLNHFYEVIKVGGAKYFEEDYKRFFCEGEDKHYIQEIKLKILKNLVTEASFDDIFNELSEYINGNSIPLAKESVLIIGELGKIHRARIRAIILLFMNVLEMKKSFLYDNIVMALKKIYSTGAFVESKEQNKFYENFESFIDNCETENGKIAVIWLLARFCENIKNSSYMINRYVKELQENSENYSEEFQLQLINSTVYIFLKKPKETLPVLSGLFSNIFRNEGQNPLIISKCKLYYQLMEKNIKNFEKFFVNFFEKTSFIQIDQADDHKSFDFMNTFSIIYHKPAESFTKNLEFFTNQRNQTSNEIESKNDVEINDDKKVKTEE